MSALPLSPDHRGRHDVLDHELWMRRHDRLDKARAMSLSTNDALLAPLVLALARLAAQRDARRLLQADDLAEAA